MRTSTALRTLIFCVLSLAASGAIARPLKLILPTHYPFTLKDAARGIALLRSYPVRDRPRFHMPTAHWKVVISERNPAFSERNPYALRPVVPFRDTLLADLPDGLGYSDSAVRAELMHYVGDGITVYAVGDEPVRSDPFGLIPATLRYGHGRSYRLLLAIQFTLRE